MASKAPSLRQAISEDEAASLLGDLVAIPSVNPLHGTEVDPPFGEAGVAKYVADFGRSLGLVVERQTVLPGRDNVLVRLEGNDPGRCLLFECHMDTVPGWTSEPGPFDPRIQGGRLYGRGACDVKGTLTSMLLALRLLVTRGIKPPRTIVLAATVDEEHQARGVHRLAADEAFAEAAVVAEPTELSVVVAHKGCVRWRLVTRGRSAHSSKAELGVNAIDAMVDVLAELRRTVSTDLMTRVHPLVGHPTMSICTIRGGVAVNVIPDECVVEIDRRTIPNEDLDRVLHSMTATVEEIVAAHPGLHAELEPPFVVDPALGTSVDAPIVKDLTRAVSTIVGRRDVRGVAFGTDASKLSQVGIPCVVFGPGSIDLAHTDQESIEIAEVARAAEILATLALDEGQV